MEDTNEFWKQIAQKVINANENKNKESESEKQESEKTEESETSENETSETELENALGTTILNAKKWKIYQHFEDYEEAENCADDLAIDGVETSVVTNEQGYTVYVATEKVEPENLPESDNKESDKESNNQENADTPSDARIPEAPKMDVETPEVNRRVTNFKNMLEFLDNHYETINAKKEEIHAFKDRRNLISDFVQMESVVMQNIVPKNTEINARTKYRGLLLSQTGFASKVVYKSQCDKHSFLELVSSFANNEELFIAGTSLDFNNFKNRKKLVAQKLLSQCIKDLKASKYRTAQRSIARLTRFKDYVEKYADELFNEEQDGQQNVFLGTFKIWNRDYTNNFFEEQPLYIISSPGSLLIRNSEEYSYRSDEYLLGDCKQNMLAAYVWGFAIDKIYSFIEDVKAVRQAKEKKVENAITELNKTFAKELLIARTKKIN